jgi:capsular exopolysaccharide synthesis family protein
MMSDGIGLADCWRIIRRYRRLIVTMLSVALLLTGIVVFFLEHNFTASATLLIEPEPPQVLDVRELISEAGSTDDHDYYKTQYDLLKSRDLAAGVIRDLNLESTGLLSSTNSRGSIAKISALFARFLDLTPERAAVAETEGVRASAIDAYLARLKIEPLIGTRLVTVSFSAPDPRLAARIANAHVRHFVHQGIQLRSESRRAAVEFLENQLVQIRQHVQQSEAALNTYRHQKGIVAFDVEDTNKIAQGRMEDLTKALTEAETKRITAESQMQQVKSGDYDSLPQVIANPAITMLKPQVRNLQAQYANLSTAFNPKYPKLAELKAQLKESTRSLNNEVKQVAKAILRDYSAAADQERELRTEISAEKERDLVQNDASLQDAVLAREVETDRELYKNVLLRMQQIQIGEQAPVTNVSVVDHAVPPLRPSTPKKKRDLLISGLLALLCGIGLAFILDQLDNRLKTSEEVEHYLHLPNLAVAPDFAMLSKATHSQQRLNQVRKFILGSEDTAVTTLAAHEPGGGDVYRSIRTALTFSRAGAPPQKMLITSAIEGEGKTWTAVHTAVAFAQTGAKTLLIDADLRRAHCHHTLGVDNSVGLSEVLVGQLDPGDSVRYLEDRNLFLLAAGSTVPNPAELLTSARMLEVLRFFSEQYQYILMDSSPLMYASDTVGIATMADGVVLVAGSATPKHSVRRAAERLALAGTNVLGVVLNRVDIRHPDHREYTRYYFSYERDAKSTVAPEP